MDQLSHLYCKVIKRQASISNLIRQRSYPSPSADTMNLLFNQTNCHHQCFNKQPWIKSRALSKLQRLLIVIPFLVTSLFIYIALNLFLTGSCLTSPSSRLPSVSTHSIHQSRSPLSIQNSPNKDDVELEIDSSTGLPDPPYEEAIKQSDPMFPPDIFTLDQKRRGAVLLHIIGVIYMFLALAVVCDEFFVPSLDVITEKLAISEDVAGATFMAAGGSAPELFTALIGVFISHDDVGIGTIVGSAVFNILFVLSMCAFFSTQTLELTWYPLFRDVSFYSFTLISLMICFKDSWITWYEALLMLIWYAGYVFFMKYNETVEKHLKQLISRGKVNNLQINPKMTAVESQETVDKMVNQLSTYAVDRKFSAPTMNIDANKLRPSVFQMMSHTINPLTDEFLCKPDRPKSVSSDRVPSITKRMNNLENYANFVPPFGSTLISLGESKLHKCSQCQEKLELQSRYLDADTLSIRSTLFQQQPTITSQARQTGSLLTNVATITLPDAKSVTLYGLTGSDVKRSSSSLLADKVKESLEETAKEPLDLSWPNLWHKRISYILLAPIIFPLWLTLPDVRRPEKRRWFVCTFAGSIIWIAFYSYLMVWWATLVGETLGIPSEIMGLTFLAAGTSIPDLVTSVLVARKGYGDMAVSSSVGSNIFDITVGLPLPWFLYTLFKGSVKVNSSGMVCSILILFMMLLFLIIIIPAFRWRLNFGLASVMFALYWAFIAVSLLLEYGVIKCADLMSFL